MNGIGIIFLLLNAVALLVLPRRWAPFPLIVGACYMTMGQGFQIGPFSFLVIRVLLFVGWVRIVIRRERVTGGLNRLDRIMLFWAGWALFCSVFHNDPSAALVYRLGLVYNALGVYFLIRIFCQSAEDVIHLINVIAILLVPVALEMIYEQLTARNLFSIFGFVLEEVTVRSERLRAQGPFAHAILAGTVGAACIPLMAGIWHKHPRSAKIGLAACLTMVFTSASSGPLMSAIFGGFALLAWRWRHLLSQMRIFAVVTYIVLDIFMERPAYFIITKFDLTGSSTGWHRAELIRSSIEHLSEWWLAGTDYTRHWMPTGVTFSADHTDITSQYIANGVHGGLPMMFLFMGALWVAFGYVGKLVNFQPHGEAKFVWALGSCLFAHAASGVSVSYFDYSFVFLYLTLAAISSLYAATANTISEIEEADGVKSHTPREAMAQF